MPSLIQTSLILTLISSFITVLEGANKSEQDLQMKLTCHQLTEIHKIILSIGNNTIFKQTVLLGAGGGLETKVPVGVALSGSVSPSHCMKPGRVIL